VAQTRQKTACSFIPTATNNYTARVYTWRNRVLQRALERLELLDAKVSRAVLRGRGVGNSILLPDTDLKDAEWIADLLQHGLLRASFVPPAPQRHFRELTRYRSTLLAERARLVNRLHKVLEDTNLKLTAVVTNIMGLSARDMLDALLQGETNAEVLAKLARGKLRKKREDLEQALVGRVDDHHRFLLTSLLTHIDFLDEQVADCNNKIEQFVSAPSDEKAELISSDDQQQEQASLASTPVGTEAMLAQDRVPEDEPKVPLSYQQAIALLDSIPGVNQRIAEIFIAEVGTDMQRFPTAQNLASWVGIVRCITRLSIPGATGKNSKGRSWVNGLPRVERQREQEHATESGREPEDAYGTVPQDPRNRVRTRLFEFQSLIGVCPHPSLQRLRAMSPHGVNPDSDTPPFVRRDDGQRVY